MEVREQTFPIASIQRVLWCAWGLILAMSMAGQFSKYFLGHDTLKGLVVLTYVDYERNVPAYFFGVPVVFGFDDLAVHHAPTTAT